MRYIRAIVIAGILTAGTFLTAAPTFAEVKFVRAEGLFMRGEEDALAKRGALEDALKKTVAQLMEGFYASAKGVDDSDFRALERNIMNDPLRYVLNYKILASGWVTHFEMPAMDGANIDEEAALRVEDTAEDLPKESAEDGTEVTGESEDKDVRPAVLARTGVEFYHLWVEASVDADFLRNEVFKVTSRGVEDSSEIEIFVLDVADHSVLKALKDKLEKIDIIKTVSYGSFSKGVSIFKAEVAGTGHSLFERLSSELMDGFVLIPGGSERVIIKSVGDES